MSFLFVVEQEKYKRSAGLKAHHFQFFDMLVSIKISALAHITHALLAVVFISSADTISFPVFPLRPNVPFFFCLPLLSAYAKMCRDV